MKRDKIIDIIKAIGIISIVAGHSAWSVTKLNIKVGPFVYMYHLMIFIFTAGYLFPIEKMENKENMYRYIGKHIYKMLILYFLYNLFFTIMHNVLIKINIINATFYTKREIIKNCLNGFVFQTNEKMLGAFWFIPMLLLTEILFVISIYKIKQFNKNKYYILFPMIFAIIGSILCEKNITMLYSIQIAILSVPFMYIGVLIKKYWNKIEKYIFTFGWIISAIILIAIIELKIGNIELSVNQIISPTVFYLVSIIGIYFCLSLAKMFNKIKYINIFMEYIGKNSFHIMALHFTSIKIVDIIYSKIKNINDVNMISRFPNSYSNILWIIYIVVGTCLPILLVLLIDSGIKYIKNKRESKEYERITINKCNNTSI